MLWPYIALITVVAFWLALFILLTRWPRVRNKSISRHSAAFKNSYLLFTPVQVVVGIVTYLFIVRWFIPRFHLSLLFSVVYTITVALQVAAAFIPDTEKGVLSRIHLHMANMMALGMLVSAFLLVLAPAIHGVPKVLFASVFLYMLACVSLIIYKKGRPERIRNYLGLQVMYVAAFQAAVLVAAFLG